MFPKISELVGTGGAYEGYLPVIQGDNAGPHQCQYFIDYVESYCAEKGWKWEPQAPQMPHANNLDSCVFPSMSKHHSALLARYCGNKEAPVEEIWKCAEQVWIDLPSHTIARGYMHCYRILQRVVKEKGDNEFLRTKHFHTGISNDYADTNYGIKKQIKLD